MCFIWPVSCFINVIYESIGDIKLNLCMTLKIMVFNSMLKVEKQFLFLLLPSPTKNNKQGMDE